MTTSRDNEQSARWNGPSGNAWVDVQDIVLGVLRPLQDILVETARAARPSRVLDVGCGTGATTFAVARALGVPCTGLDIAEPMITAARINAENDSLPVDFLLADAQTHPFTPAYDLIISRFGVMFFPDPVAAFTNLRRAARPRGALSCIVWRAPEENPFFTTAERAAAELLPDLPPRIPNAPGQFGLADSDHTTGILSKSGWTDVTLTPLDVPLSMSEPDLTPYISRLGPVGLALADADDDTRAKVVETIRPAFDDYIDNGEVHFTAACWHLTARV
ncbi:class I SAM-dependent methyltransferase [Nocardia yunnanensis]|uniref:Class I SAM-dependent methyltransferase n=1 Tax=Nocardia yunnanensis TaxID=2382165 RepID=A0A386ZIY9_9NOCA|nr:class I SAM-dependent methyltransferase [Nocardia yunnanensis]AYF77466.1 class I SAM-dependent methyltransferase [Nocardia yunnanensis]